MFNGKMSLHLDDKKHLLEHGTKMWPAAEEAPV
jgi:hypothetical protein